MRPYFHMLLLSLLLPIFSNAQSNVLPGLFLDCQMGCDFTYIKQQVQFVNYMLNRQEADIYVLATDQETGAGGEQVQLVFIGNHAFAGMTDTLTFFVDPNATDALEREQFVKELKKGLLPFLMQSPLAGQIDYSVKAPMQEEGSEKKTEKDPWNYWVFNLGGSASMDGEASYRSSSLNGRFSASRVTDLHKFRLNTFYNYDQSSFFLPGGEKYTRLLKSYFANALYVKSYGSHWSAGLNASLGSSTFGNTDLSASFKPALEYNIFPYEEVQTKQFSFLYSIGPEHFNYTDTTIYDKLSQTLLRHGLNMVFSQTQKWGDISLSFGVEQFLHKPSLFNAYLNPEIEWQIVKGLSFDMGGYFSFVRDRINISKADITDEEILLQIKQLNTSFAYFSYLGLNYRIGSKFNNFVNPRFESLN